MKYYLNTVCLLLAHKFSLKFHLKILALSSFSSVIGIIYNTKETHQYLEKMSEMKLFKRKWFEYLKLITEISIEHQRVTK